MDEFMQKAMEEARTAQKEGGFGAVLVRDGKMISTAHNSTHLNGDPTDLPDVCRSNCILQNSQGRDWSKLAWLRAIPYPVGIAGC